MQTSDFFPLLTREGQWAIESAAAFEPREKDFLQDFKMLAKRFPREIARGALTTAILRIEARSKFPKAEKMYFTREAFEQATPWAVAAYRAQRFQGYSQILDLGCSIGSDTIALAQISPTIGVDQDMLRLAMAAANAKALNTPAVFIQADLNNSLPFAIQNQAIFFDPARRKDHKRAFSVEDYQPPLSVIQAWLEHTPAISVKISPGVKLEELAKYDCEIEFISLNGDLKEACLWFGPFKTATRRATLLPSGATMTAEDEHVNIPLSEPSQFIIEPDPAILRARLVTNLGKQLNAAQLDPEIAYLTAESYTPTPFGRAWKIEDWFPFQLKRLRAYLHEQNVGTVTVKKRGSPILPEDLIRDLKLEGDEQKTLFLTQMQGKPIVIIAQAETMG